MEPTRALLVSVLMLVMPATAWGQSGGTYHVDPAGVGGACSDSRPPAQAAAPATPWCTIGRAVEAAPPAAVALVRRSTIGTLTINGKRRSGPLTVRPFPGEGVQLEDVNIAGSSGVRLEGFSITRGLDIGAGTHTIELVGNMLRDGVGLRAGAGPLLIAGNRIGNADGTGINFSADNTDAPIVGVTISGNRFDGIGVDAIQAKNFRDLVVEGNEFSNVRRIDSSAHPDVLQTVFGGNGLVFRNNWLHDYEAQGFFISDGGVSNVRVENNVIERSDGSYSPVRIADAQGVTFVNNTVRGLARFSAKSRDVVIKNNIIEDFDLDRSQGMNVLDEDYNLIESGPRTGRHDRSGSPRFVNEHAGDFELQPSSPAVDAGTSDGAPTLDRLGRTRVDDPGAANLGGGTGVHDIGALERGGRLPSHGGEGPGARLVATKIKFRVRKTSLKRLAKRGVKVVAHCPSGCRVVATLRVRRRVARRLGLLGRRHRIGERFRSTGPGAAARRGRYHRLGRDSDSRADAGRLVLRVRISRRERRALRRAHRIRLALDLRAVDSSGALQHVTRRVRLRRP